MRSLQFRARWAVCAEALDAAVLQYDFAGQFVQLIDERRSPLEWRDNTAWADTGGWRLTATHSGELVDESRAEARQDITVHLDDVCPNVQSLFFVVCARDSTVGRAISRPQVELRALEHGGGSVDLPTLLPLGNAAATAGSAVVCRVWRSSIADSWVAERVGLPAPAVDEDEYDRLIDAVATWLSVQMSARSTLDNPPPRAQSPHRAIAAEPFAAVAPGGASAVATDASGNSKPRRVAVRANGARQSEPHRMSEDGVEAREQLEEELSQLREKLAQSKESQHAAVQQVERLKKANHELQALIRTQRTESETARKTAADSHAAEMVLLTQRRRSAAAARQRKVAASPTQQLSASPAVDADRSEVTDDHSQQMLLAELQALQMEHDAKCEELACCQTQLNSSKARADKAERELQEHRERRDNEAVDAIMAPCTAERVASLETFLEEEKASKRELETERDALRGEKKCWNKERRKMISLETKLREQIRDLKGKVAQVRRGIISSLIAQTGVVPVSSHGSLTAMSWLSVDLLTGGETGGRPARERGWAA